MLLIWLYTFGHVVSENVQFGIARVQLTTYLDIIIIVQFISLNNFTIDIIVGIIGTSISVL